MAELVLMQLVLTACGLDYLLSRCSTDESDNGPFYDGEDRLAKFTGPLEGKNSLGGSRCAEC